MKSPSMSSPVRAAPARCRRSGRRAARASPATTSSASTMRALVRTVSAVISGSLSFLAAAERVTGFHHERRAGFGLDKQRQPVHRHRLVAAPARKTSSIAARTRGSSRVGRRGRSASCGSGSSRTHRDSPTGRGCGTPPGSAHRDCGARSRPRSAARGNGRSRDHIIGETVERRAAGPPGTSAKKPSIRPATRLRHA